LEKTREMVINMYNKDLTFDIISDCSGLSINEIKKIIEEFKKRSM